jgi:hypothetical protein
MPLISLASAALSVSPLSVVCSAYVRDYAGVVASGASTHLLSILELFCARFMAPFLFIEFVSRSLSEFMLILSPSLSLSRELDSLGCYRSEGQDQQLIPLSLVKEDVVEAYAHRFPWIRRARETFQTNSYLGKGFHTREEPSRVMLRGLP